MEKLKDIGLKFINKLRPCIFKYKNIDDLIHFGFIAQDVEEILDDRTDLAIIRKDENDYLMINYTEFIAPIVKAVQELNQKVIKQEEEIELLNKKIVDIEIIIKNNVGDNNEITC